jgi:hypothetical protein
MSLFENGRHEMFLKSFFMKIFCSKECANTNFINDDIFVKLTINCGERS